MYKNWQSSFPSHIEIIAIEYPGHISRIREKLFQTMEDLVPALVLGILPILREGIPFAFFGHSLGGWVAFETTKSLQKTQAPLPAKLFCSAIRSPTTSHEDVDPICMHTLRPEEFWSKMQERYGLQSSSLDPEIKDITLPILKADFRIAETYDPPSTRFDEPLSMPLCVMGGLEDPRYMKTQLDQWVNCCAVNDVAQGNIRSHYSAHPKSSRSSVFEVRMFKGGHNYAFSLGESQEEAKNFLIDQIDRLASSNGDANGQHYVKISDKDGSVHSGVSDAMGTMGSTTSHQPPSSLSGWPQKMNRDDVDIDENDQFEAPSPRVGCFQCVYWRTFFRR